MKWLYKITNTLSGKKYIGVTVDPERRWRQHKNKNTNCSVLKSAMNKYGNANFSFELIFYGEDTYVDQLEVEFIKEYETLAPNGYNITLGGDGGNLYCWKDEWNSLLGLDTDKNVAKKLRVPLDVVNSRRRGLKVPPYKDSLVVDWTSYIKILGTKPDPEIAKIIGVTPNRIYQKRKELGIPPYSSPPPSYHHPDELIRLLGTKSDKDLAEQFEVSFTSVYNKRISLSIPKFVPEQGHRKLIWDDNQQELLKDNTLTQSYVAKVLNVSVSTVVRYRKDHCVGRYVGKNKNGKTSFIPLEGEFLEDMLNSELSNKDISLKYNYKVSTVWAKRKSKKFLKIKEERGIE
ncbi:putative GIY-YIG nuclease superfamily protein [Vibrio phage 424E50-1]|nr:putative GIY-YIG nuclease superfamily protein [Vibrio phage 424E50-1]